jgi:hypothetical protein
MCIKKLAINFQILKIKIAYNKISARKRYLDKSIPEINPKTGVIMKYESPNESKVMQVSIHMTLLVNFMYTSLLIVKRYLE